MQVDVGVGGFPSPQPATDGASVLQPQGPDLCQHVLESPGSGQEFSPANVLIAAW
jgi:hypothetical protein